jgi:hypothetical protein
MSYLYAFSFLGGLLLGVALMLFGVERRRRATAQVPRRVVAIVDALTEMAGQEISARYTLPVIASLLTAFGAVGYVLTRGATLNAPLRFVIAAAAGALAAVGVVLLIAKWAIPSAREEAVDLRYLLQGHLARVTRPIGPSEPGEITYEVDGVPYVTPAASLTALPMGIGTDVVIERIEDGRAYVEPWLEVEKRL